MALRYTDIERQYTLGRKILLKIPTHKDYFGETTADLSLASLPLS